MSHVACHMSCVVFFLGGGGDGGRANIAASSGWRVCHPLGTPCLLLIQTTIVVYCNSIDSVENLKSATYSKFSKISNFYVLEICTSIIHTFAITPSKGHQSKGNFRKMNNKNMKCSLGCDSISHLRTVCTSN